MSSQGYHAADDGSLARSTGGAAARGAMLIALALIIGLLLMAFALDDPPTDLSAGAATDTTETTDDTAGDTGDDATDTSDDNAVSVGEPDDDGGGTTEGTIAPDPDDTPTETIPEDVVAGELRPASEVNILVANGIGGKGVAGSVANKLKAEAYIANVSNAPSTAEAVIYYRVGYDADARRVAEILGSPPDIIKPAPGDGTLPVAPEAVTDGRLTSANIVVLIGADGNVPTS